MNFFKSVWMRMRKSNQLPGNTVLVPISTEEQVVTAGTSTPVAKPKPKRIVVRKKKDANNT